MVGPWGTLLVGAPLTGIRLADSVGPASAFQAAAARTPHSTRGALNALLTDIGMTTTVSSIGMSMNGTDEGDDARLGAVLRRAPDVTAACFPDFKAPLLAAVTALGEHAAKAAVKLGGAAGAVEGSRRSRPRAAGPGVSNADTGMANALIHLRSSTQNHWKTQKFHS